MSLNNFIVRPKRKVVAQYSQREAWNSLTNDEAMDMANQLSALPSQLRDTEEEAKRFDLMILRAQLCILQNNPGFDRLKTSIQDIVEALELQESIPAIRNQMQLIQSLLTDDWWQDVTVGMLEHVRRQLHLLVKLIEKTKRPIIFTDFEDEIGEGNAIDLTLKPVGLNYERFKNKTRDFLREHEDRIAIQKLRRNLPITQSDSDELEKILLEQAANNNDLVDKARDEAGGLDLFVRSLVGLERTAAVEAMSEFLNDSTATASQLEFIRLIVECLTNNGTISDDLFYQSPFTDFAPTEPEGIFPAAKITQLNGLIQNIRQRAVA
jgi:type I restriction enzyme, R subunit